MNDPEAISDLITKLAGSYDPVFEADGLAIRAFTQGALAGISMKRDGLHLKVTDVETPVDDEGNYENYFVIVTESGHRIRVTVALED